MSPRRVRFWWQQDAFSGWRKLYASFHRPGEAKAVKTRTNRYARRVDKGADIREQLEE